MDDERNTDERDEMNEDNDAREEDVVEDTDADTQDVEETEHEEYDEIERRFSSIEATLERILGQLSSFNESLGVMVENGAVVNDTDTEIGHSEEDEFVPPEEMDLLV